MGRKKSTPAAAPQQQSQAKPIPEKKAEAPPAKGQKAQPAAKEAPTPAVNTKGAKKKGGKNSSNQPSLCLHYSASLHHLLSITQAPSPSQVTTMGRKKSSSGAPQQQQQQQAKPMPEKKAEAPPAKGQKSQPAAKEAPAPAAKGKKGGKKAAGYAPRILSLRSLATQIGDDHPEPEAEKTLSHVSEDRTTPQMVDVGNKTVTRRSATARSTIRMPPHVLQQLTRGGNELVGAKGPVGSTAIIAGVLGAKQTSSLIPFCHPLPIEDVQIRIHVGPVDSVEIECTVRVTHKTGVEMEALTGASVAALCVYDMCKALSHDLVIESTRLVAKTGGKSDFHCD